jgi:hypothetical protein
MKYLLDTNIPLYLEDIDSPFNHAVQGLRKICLSPKNYPLSILTVPDVFRG